MNRKRSILIMFILILLSIIIFNLDEHLKFNYDWQNIGVFVSGGENCLSTQNIDYLEIDLARNIIEIGMDFTKTCNISKAYLDIRIDGIKNFEIYKISNQKLLPVKFAGKKENTISYKISTENMTLNEGYVLRFNATFTNKFSSFLNINSYNRIQKIYIKYNRGILGYDCDDSCFEDYEGNFSKEYSIFGRKIGKVKYGIKRYDNVNPRFLLRFNPKRKIISYLKYLFITILLTCISSIIVKNTESKEKTIKPSVTRFIDSFCCKCKYTWKRKKSKMPKRCPKCKSENIISLK